MLLDLALEVLSAVSLPNYWPQRARCIFMIEASSLPCGALPCLAGAGGGGGGMPAGSSLALLAFAEMPL